MIRIIFVLVVFLLSLHARYLNADTERDPDIGNRMRFAIVEGDTESVKNFLEQGADANIVYTDGVTPLADAINRSRAPIDIVKVLIQYGADPKLKSNGISPLTLAQNKNDEELIEIFRQYVENDLEFYDLALFYLNKEKEVQALYYADEALKLNPMNARAWALKGSLLLSLFDNIKDAATAYQKAFTTSLTAPKSEEEYLSSARYALMADNFKEAVRLANEGLSIFGENGKMGLNAAHAMLLLGQKKEALSFYRKAYAGLQNNNTNAAKMVSDDFANLKKRYPDKESELKWAETKILEPFDFTFDEMPFGEGIDYVLSMVKGAEVNDEEKPVLGRLDPILMKQLGRGLYPADSGTQLNPDCAEKFSVTYGKWGALRSIDLFFAGREGQRTLFLVNKFYKESGRSDDIFSRYQETISKAIKIEPAVHTTQIGSESGPAEVKIAVWKPNNITIILEALKVSSASAQLRIMYVSKKGWEDYIRLADPATRR